MAVLAHQGGWDEALFVVIPLLFIIGLLWMAKRRADGMQHERAETAAADAASSNPGSSNGDADHSA